jgi:hypothetical protein
MKGVKSGTEEKALKGILSCPNRNPFGSFETPRFIHKQRPVTMKLRWCFGPSVF